MRYKELSWEIVGAAIDVQRSLGPGLLESSYHRCLELELTARGIDFETDVPVTVEHRGLVVERAYEADLVVAGRIVVELKAVSAILPVHVAQLKTYMRWLGKDVGYVLNFNAATITGAGMERIICSHFLK